MALKDCFTAHPSSINETYLEHAKCASHYAKELFLAAGAATVHAVFPAFFETTASDKIKAMCADMEARHGAADCDEAETAAPQLVSVG